MKIKVLFDKVLVEPITNNNEGIYIPESAKENCSSGKVVKLGQGVYIEEQKRFLDFPFKVGDIVYFKNDCLDYILINNKKYLLLSLSEILAYQPSK